MVLNPCNQSKVGCEAGFEAIFRNTFVVYNVANIKICAKNTRKNIVSGYTVA